MNKIITLILLLLVSATSQDTTAADTAWQKEAIGSLSFSQANFDNWASGGENTLALQFDLGGKLIKDVSGYNMVQLMVGSEGTLGLFTKIILKLMPLPRAQVDLLCLFKTSEQAIGVIPKIETLGGIYGII